MEWSRSLVVFIERQGAAQSEEGTGERAVVASCGHEEAGKVAVYFSSEGPASLPRRIALQTGYEVIDSIPQN